MTAYTVQCQYATYVCAIVSVDAHTLENACQAAIDMADADDLWKSSDYVGDSHVTSICERSNGSPWACDSSPIPVPEKYAKDPPPPLITIDPTNDQPSIEVTRGTVRLRFVTPSSTLTTDVSASPPPRPAKPVIIIKPRPDGAPDVTVAAGEAIVRIEDWT